MSDIEERAQQLEHDADVHESRGRLARANDLRRVARQMRDHPEAFPEEKPAAEVDQDQLRAVIPELLERMDAFLARGHELIADFEVAVAKFEPIMPPTDSEVTAHARAAVAEKEAEIETLQARIAELEAAEEPDVSDEGGAGSEEGAPDADSSGAPVAETGDGDGPAVEPPPEPEAPVLPELPDA